MKLIKRKLIEIGGSRGVTISPDFIRMQNPDDGYFVFYVPDELERKQLRA